MARNNKLPERWLDYSKMGVQIDGTPFVAFKVPLGQNFFNKLPVQERFTVDDLIKQFPRMGMIIDLTNTSRYYLREDVERKGVFHRKVPIPGRKVPTFTRVKYFCNLVHEFLGSRSANEDTLIGVHCTHGVNRTGFMICSFMVRHLGISPRDAIIVFQAARGHVIEREEYVEALTMQSSDGLGPHVGALKPRGVLPIRIHAYGTVQSSSGNWNTEYYIPPSKKKTLAPTSAHPTCNSRNHLTGKLEQEESEGPDAGGCHKKEKKKKRNKSVRCDNNQPCSSRQDSEDGSARYHDSRASHGGRPAKPGSAHLKSSPTVSQNRNLETREDPAYGGPKRWRKKERFTSSPQPMYQPLPRPSPQFPSSHPSSAERGFGPGVERERGPEAGPATSRGGGGGGWRRARGGDQPGRPWGWRASEHDGQFDQRIRGRGGGGRGGGRGSDRRPWSNQRPRTPAGFE